jgi:hypothetical protein
MKRNNKLDQPFIASILLLTLFLQSCNTLPSIGDESKDIVLLEEEKIPSVVPDEGLIQEKKQTTWWDVLSTINSLSDYKEAYPIIRYIPDWMTTCEQLASTGNDDHKKLSLIDAFSKGYPCIKKILEADFLMNCLMRRNKH